jgi:UrcA family protein
MTIYINLVQFPKIECAVSEIGPTGWFAAHFGGSVNAASRHPEESIMFRAKACMPKMFLSLALAGMLLSGSARAAEQSSEGVAVSVQDRDLSASGAEAKLRHRVLVAAYKVCSAVDPSAAIGSDAFIECLQAARRDAADSVSALVGRYNANRQFALSASSR